MDHATYRILDVNLNRLREALRVIEDFARFVLEDRDAALTVKQLRHAIRDMVVQLGEPELSRSRDIRGDVGCDAKVAGELHRGGTEDVVAAALARGQEAARSIGEYAKPIQHEAALRAERIRYVLYELEQRIRLRGALRKRFRTVGLYVILTRELCRSDWLETAEAALLGGARCLQLREKSLTDRQLLEAARRLRELTLRHDALFIVNDRPDIAVLAHADGVHLGQDDLSVDAARRLLGGAALIGKSTHTPEQFRQALLEQPDYLAIGPMFATRTKPQPHIAGLEVLRAVSSETALPVVAIGGITLDTIEQVARCGAACACVCSSVISAAEPRGAAEELLRRFQDARAMHPAGSSERCDGD